MFKRVWQNQCSNDQGKKLRVISARKTSHKQQQRPEPSTITLTWHASKYKVHKLHQELRSHPDVFRALINSLVSWFSTVLWASFCFRRILQSPCSDGLQSVLKFNTLCEILTQWRRAIECRLCLPLETKRARCVSCLQGDGHRSLHSTGIYLLWRLPCPFSVSFPQ